MTTTSEAHTRREADRAKYLECQRAAQAMRMDALRWQQLRDDLIADPAVYGSRAGDYQAGVRARLDIVIGWAEAEAERHDGYAASYFELLGAE